MSKLQSPFTVAVLYGLNAIEYLENASVERRLSVEEIANATGAPRAMLAHVLRHLSAAGIVDAKKGPGGGYRASSLGNVTVLDVMRCLGQEVEEPIGNRGSDRLKAALYDAVNVPLEEFFR